MNARAGRWLREAEEELAVARALHEHRDLPPRAACLHAQLAAEEAIKAVLIERGVELRRSHDLFLLVELLPEDDASAADEDDLELLNPWAIAGRYPADFGDVTAQRANAVLGAGARVVSNVVDRLE